MCKVGFENKLPTFQSYTVFNVILLVPCVSMGIYFHACVLTAVFLNICWIAYSMCVFWVQSDYKFV